MCTHRQNERLPAALDNDGRLSRPLGYSSCDNLRPPPPPHLHFLRNPFHHAPIRSTVPASGSRLVSSSHCASRGGFPTPNHSFSKRGEMRSGWRVGGGRRRRGVFVVPRRTIAARVVARSEDFIRGEEAREYRTHSSCRLSGEFMERWFIHTTVSAPVDCKPWERCSLCPPTIADTKQFHFVLRPCACFSSCRCWLPVA